MNEKNQNEEEEKEHFVLKEEQSIVLCFILFFSLNSLSLLNVPVRLVLLLFWSVLVLHVDLYN